MASVALLSLFVISLTGCSLVDPGPSTVQERAVENVTSVELDTSGSLVITHGDEASLTVTAGENVIDLLTSEVSGETLSLGVDGDPLAVSGDIQYELTVPVLDAITVRGSGDATVNFSGAAEPEITLNGSGSVTATDVVASRLSVNLDGSGEIDVSEIEVDEITTKIDGSGKVQLGGRATAQTAEIRGSGEFAADELHSANAKIIISGSGNVSASVADALDAVIDGSGEIRFSGSPVVTKDVTGSGDVIAH